MSVEAILDAMALAKKSGEKQEVQIKTSRVIVGPNGPLDIITEHGRNADVAMSAVSRVLAQTRLVDLEKQ